MHRSILTALFAALLGCAAARPMPRPIAPARVPVTIYVPAGYDAEALLARWERAHALGLPVTLRAVRGDVPENPAYGIHVGLIPTLAVWMAAGTAANGVTDWASPCRAVIIIRDDEGDTLETLAHELGHALGLEHVAEADNLMHPIGVEGRRHLTDAQRKRMRAVADAWELCTP